MVQYINFCMPNPSASKYRNFNTCVVYIICIVPLLIVTSACGTSSNENKQDLTLENTAAVTTLPKIDRIKLEDLEGNEINLSDFKGKRVFLNLWATWCKPCIAEMPSIDRAFQHLKNEDFVFLLASDEKMEKIRRFVEKRGDFSFQFVHMINSVYDLEVVALPTTLIINRNGEIVYEKAGAREWDSEDVLKELRNY